MTLSPVPWYMNEQQHENLFAVICDSSFFLLPFELGIQHTEGFGIGSSWILYKASETMRSVCKERYLGKTVMNSELLV